MKPHDILAADGARTAADYPVRLLTIALILTAVTFAWLSYVIFDLTRDAIVARDPSPRMAELRGSIIHLDAMTAMDARLGVATGDPKSEEQHRRLTENAIVHRGVLVPAVAFLAKPYSPGMLARKLRETLDAPDANPAR